MGFKTLRGLLGGKNGLSEDRYADLLHGVGTCIRIDTAVVDIRSAVCTSRSASLLKVYDLKKFCSRTFLSYVQGTSDRILGLV